MKFGTIELFGGYLDKNLNEEIVNDDIISYLDKALRALKLRRKERLSLKKDVRLTREEIEANSILANNRFNASASQIERRGGSVDEIQSAIDEYYCMCKILQNKDIKKALDLEFSSNIYDLYMNKINENIYSVVRDNMGGVDKIYTKGPLNDLIEDVAEDYVGLRFDLEIADNKTDYMEMAYDAILYRVYEDLDIEDSVDDLEIKDVEKDVEKQTQNKKNQGKNKKDPNNDKNL